MKAYINGINLSYTDQGEGSPLIFIHAFPLSGAMWETQVQALSDTYRIITLDLRGHGESDAPLWHYTMDDYADDIQSLVQHLRLQHATFIGLSMGGYTLLAFYRKYPELVKAMVLADTRAQADSEEAKAGRFAMVQIAYKEGPKAIADLMMPKLLAPSTVENKKDLVDQVRAIILNNQSSGIIVDLIAMAQRLDSTQLLPQITCPTLVIVGEDDVATPPSEAQYLVDQIPNSHLEIIRNAGHLSNIEQPITFNQALESFVKEIT